MEKSDNIRPDDNSYYSIPMNLPLFDEMVMYYHFKGHKTLEASSNLTETIVNEVLSARLGFTPGINEYQKTTLFQYKDNIVIAYNGELLGEINFENNILDVSKPDEPIYRAEIKATFNPKCDREQIMKAFFESLKCKCCGKKVFNLSGFCDSCWKKELMGTFPTIPYNYWKG